MGHGLQREEHQPPHLQHHPPRQRSAEAYCSSCGHILEMHVCSWTLCFIPRRGGTPVVPGGQRSLCTVSDRGTSQLSSAAADTGVSVSFPIYQSSLISSRGVKYEAPACSDRLQIVNLSKKYVFSFVFGSDYLVLGVYYSLVD